MGRINTTVLIDEAVKEMAKSKGIHLSNTLEDALKTELEIVDVRQSDSDMKVYKLKQKVRKLLEILRENRTKIADLEAKLVRFEAKKGQNKSHIHTHSERMKGNVRKFNPVTSDCTQSREVIPENAATLARRKRLHEECKRMDEHKSDNVLRRG